MERVINKDKQTAINIFEKMYYELLSFEDDIDDIARVADEYSPCTDEECLDVLDIYDSKCTLEKKMRELVRLHNEFEKALDAYKNYVEVNF